MNQEADGIKPVSPISPVSPANGYNAYQNSYLDNRKRNRDQQKKQHPNSNQDGDYFEKSDEGDAEYLYKSDGTFMETKSDMKRLVTKEAYSMSPITDRAEGDLRSCLPTAPMYAIDDNSYSNYVNQNPKNKYIMKMRGELPPEPEIMTLKDYNERYFEDDGFTMRTTPKAAATEKRLVRKADDGGSSSSSSSSSPSSSCDSGSSCDSDGYGCGVGVSSPTVPYYTPEYLKKRKELMDTQQKQRSPQDLKNDKKKPFKEILKDQLRMFYD